MMMGKMARNARTLAIVGLCVIVPVLLLVIYSKASIDNRGPRIISGSILRDDEFVRNCITRKIIGNITKNVEIVSYNKPDNLTSNESDQGRKEAFEGIFKKRTWLQQQNRDFTKMVASGPGSTLSYSQEAMAGLHSIISEIKDKHGLTQVRLLDIPCGDMVWMSRFLATRDDIIYTGMDIVPDIISHHQKKYADRQVEFVLQDIVTTPLADSFDLILCRMMLQHLLTKHVDTILRRFSDSGSRYLLTTTHHQRSSNEELAKEGGFRQLNMELPPFSLIPPLCIFRDGEPQDENGKTHSLALWSLPLKQVKQCSETFKFSADSVAGKIVSCVDWSFLQI